MNDEKLLLQIVDTYATEKNLARLVYRLIKHYSQRHLVHMSYWHLEKLVKKIDSKVTKTNISDALEITVAYGYVVKSKRNYSTIFIANK